ncbi:MAG: hemin uptake protein HemP [Planctomycetaceae bacterium]|nr:hemin uptake protein HemP [Planctomycetaceae bacterium]
MNEPQKPAPVSQALPEPVLKKITFQQLAAGASEVLVEHDGQVYRLRLTRNGKLILNK